MGPQAAASGLSTVLAIVTIVANALGTIVIVGTLVWKMGALYAKIDDLEDAVKKLSTGDSPVCARHDERLENHERRLDAHEREFAELRRLRTADAG